MSWTIKLERETKDESQGGMGPERWLGNQWKQVIVIFSIIDGILQVQLREVIKQFYSLILILSK
jgi:hypothetical protein